MSEFTGIPRIGAKAPDFTAVTTQGTLNFSEWQGDSWVVLFSHPADFTPVCTTELASFARKADEFSKRNVKLIGLSIDSVHSHMAWLEDINANLGVEIPYPMIADLDTQVAQKYGMIHPGESSTVTVRAVFVIDPDRTIKALIYYPLTNGRSIDEVLRLVDSLQTSREYGVATPAGWTPGNKVVVPPTTDVASRKVRAADETVEHVTSYLALKEL